MARLAAVTVASLAMAVFMSAQALQKPKFVPPRLTAAELPPLPAPTVVGGGEVLIEALVARNGAVLRPVIVRGTPPYTQFVLDVIPRWRFDPARDIDYKGLETAVDMPVMIAAIYRPPVLMNTPTIGEPPKDWSKPSGDAPFPVALTMPNYPPQARDGGVVLFELSITEDGAVKDARAIGATIGFESASRQALASWRFKGGMYRARPVPATAYVLFGFRPPVGLQQVVCLPNDERVECPCRANDSRPHCKPQTPGAAMSPKSFGILSFR